MGVLAEAVQHATLHNDLLAYLYDNNLNVSSLEECRIDIEYFMTQNGFSSSDVVQAMSDVTPVINEAFIAFNDADPAVYQAFIDLKCDDVAMSDQFKTDIDTLVGHANLNERTQIFDKVFNLMATRDWNHYDQLNYNILRVTLDLSDRYWELPKVTPLSRDSWVILNDAIGGIFGLPFGPAGSIVLGAALSIGTEEGW